MGKKDVIIVTGGSSGIGAAIVETLLEDGCRVLNFDRQPPSYQTNAIFVNVDLTDPQEIQSGFAECDRIGSVVGLVNNAGAAISASIQDTTEEDFDKLVPLNVMAPFLCTKLAAMRMSDGGWGRIVNISSRAALGKEQRTAYAATKGALLSMTRVWALELAEFGITVNAIGPGPVATELFRRVNPEGSGRAEALKRSIPLGKVGDPEDIGRAAAFFLDQRNGFVTGQTLYVCGGLSLGVVAV